MIEYDICQTPEVVIRKNPRMQTSEERGSNLAQKSVPRAWPIAVPRRAEKGNCANSLLI